MALRTGLLAWVGLALLVAGPHRPTVAGEVPYAAWKDARDRAALLFAGPGALEEKRALIDLLLRDAQPRSWAILRQVLERECAHLPLLQQERAGAWSETLHLWRRPRARHFRETVRALLARFRELAAADVRFFEEADLVADLTRRLAQTPPPGWFPLLTPSKGWRDGEAGVQLRVALARVAAHHLEDPAAARAFHAFLARDEDARVRLAALEVLGEGAQGPDAWSTDRLDDDDWAVRVVAARTVADRRLMGAIPLLIRGLDDERPRVAEAFGEALRALTGQGFEADGGAWRRWWEAEGRAAHRGGDVGTRSEPAPPSPRFYGVPLQSDRVVFVIDTSGSMGEPASQGAGGDLGKDAGSADAPLRKIDVVKRELKRSIAGLPRTARFGVVAFDGRIHPWEDAPVEATDAHKASAAAWIDALEANWNTCLGGALRQAFRMAGLAPCEGAAGDVDTIVVLSDGLPTWYAYGAASPQDPEEVLRLVRRWNLHRRIRIHTVAVHGGQVQAFLRRLAEENGGHWFNL